MTHHVNLDVLARADEAAPPFGYEEFERRRTAALVRRRAGMWSAATSVAALGLVVLLAVMTQSPDPAALLVNPGPAATATGAVAPMQPAVVDLGQFVMTSELEDHIALLDAQISAARVYAAPPEQLRQLEYTRSQLNDSLQRVSYAQTLLKF
jgi:hypothetical protein